MRKATAAAAAAPRGRPIPSSFQKTGTSVGENKHEREFKRTRIMMTFNTNRKVPVLLATTYGARFEQMAESLFGGATDQERTDNFSRFVRMVIPYKKGEEDEDMLSPCTEDDEEYVKPVLGLPQRLANPEIRDIGYRGGTVPSNRGYLFGIDPDNCEINVDNVRLFSTKSKAEVGPNEKQGGRLHLHLSILVIHRGHIRFLRNKIQNYANQWCAAMGEHFPFRIQYFNMSVKPMTTEEYLWWVGGEGKEELVEKAPTWRLNLRKDEYEETGES